MRTRETTKTFVLALGGPDTCPVGFVLQESPEPDAQGLADRNGRVCAKAPALAGRMLAFGGRRGANPAPCASPFGADDAIGYAQLDRNGDGVLCSAVSGRTLVLLDNAYEQS